MRNAAGEAMSAALLKLFSQATGRVYPMQIEYKSIDPKLVVNEIRNGRSLESVQKIFGLKFKSEVQDLYLKGLMELGEIPRMEFTKPTPKFHAFAPETERPAPVIVKKRERPVSKPSTLIRTGNLRTIGQSDSITLNRALLIEQLGFGAGDSFEIYREDDTVVLKKTDGAA